MNVYVLMFQIGESANTVAACATFNGALRAAQEDFVKNLLTCGAIEYGRSAMAVFEAIRDRVGTDDLVLSVRKPIPKDIAHDDEFWIDAMTKNGTKLQPAIITITKKAVDQKAAPAQGGVKFVIEGSSTRQ